MMNDKPETEEPAEVGQPAQPEEDILGTGKVLLILKQIRLRVIR